MPLPYQFANVTALRTPELDANFAALAQVAFVPGAIVGTNSLVLTPLADVATVSGYTPLQAYSGIISATNTGPVVFRVGTSLSALQAFKDSPAGPQPLSGNELIVGNLAVFYYDAALDGGNGGFHVESMAAGQGGTASFSQIVLTAGGSITSTLNASVALLNSIVAAGTFTGQSIAGTALGISGTASVGGLRVGSDTTTLARKLSTTATINFGAVPPAATSLATVVLVGSSVGDIVLLGLPQTLNAGMVFDGHVTATSVVTVRATNITAGTITVASATYRIGTEGYV
jgi:hypothetical protein